MKKLIVLFVALFVVVLISGCSSRENTVRFEDRVSEGSSEDASDESVSDTETSEETDVEVPEGQKMSPGKLEVTSFDGAHLKTKNAYNVVRGTVPQGTHSVKVNKYTLQQFVPGQTKWNYIAYTGYNTLKDGWNDYVVKTYDANGKETGSLMFSIDYEMPKIESLPSVGLNHWILLLFSLSVSGAYFFLRRRSWL